MTASRVLVVDDNELNLEMATFDPDLVLLDIQLPGFDGMAVAQRLRGTPRARPLAIVAFTAYAMMGDKERFLAVGCDGYIAKPIQVATFADEVRALLPPGSAGGAQGARTQE